MIFLFRLMPLAAACVTLLSACGGGGAVTPSASVNAPVAGTISGLGSIVVNGVRYETIGASVIDADDGHSIQTALGLGMTVSIEPLSTNASAAGTIYLQGGLKGSAEAIDPTSKTLTVAGLPVTTDATTLIVTALGVPGTFADLSNNAQVEVYGLPQTDGTFKATRIEIETSTQQVQLVGTVSNLNTTNGTFNLGTASQQVTVAYAGLQVPAGLANGSVVSVHTTSSNTATRYNASSVYLRSTDVSNFTQYVENYRGTSPEPNHANELYGMVSGLTQNSAGCTMQVQGIPTTLSSAALCSALQDGDYVEVKGLLANGSLKAYKVEFKTAGGDRALSGYADDESDSDHDELKYLRRVETTGSSQHDSSAVGYSYEIYGTLSACSGTTCTLTTGGSNLVADMSTAIWEHGQVSSGFVEAKGYMTSTSTFKVLKIEAKY